jgi:hypothetical protein
MEHSSITFEEWNKQVNDKLAQLGKSPSLEEEWLYMAYSMEGKSVNEVVDEILQAIEDGNL